MNGTQPPGMLRMAAIALWQIVCYNETNQRLINDDKNHRCVSYEGEITFDNYLRIDNSYMEPDEVARLIKEIFNL